MAIVHDDDLAGVLLQAPAGVALLAELENTYGRNGGPDAVATTIDAVGAMSFGELVAQALNGAHDIGGPWTAGAPAALAEAYAAAEARRPVAEAVVARFGPELKADLLTVNSSVITKLLDVPARKPDRQASCNKTSHAADECGYWRSTSIRTV